MINSRQQLLDFITAKSAIHAVCRAIKEDGTVENLGGFHKIPGSKLPGWIVLVTTRFDQFFKIAVVCDESTRSYRTYDMTPFMIPWIDHVDSENLHPLYAGDKPDEYKIAKDFEALKEEAWKILQKKN
jgi:hypothetical protein